MTRVEIVSAKRTKSRSLNRVHSGAKLFFSKALSIRAFPPAETSREKHACTSMLIVACVR
jgi:hypothetical protein